MNFELPDLVLRSQEMCFQQQASLYADAIVRVVGTDGTNTKIKTKKDGSLQSSIEEECGV
jgi:hypothetical protein